MSIYRQHTKDCIRGYPKTKRIFFSTEPSFKKIDCACSIYGEGKLSEHCYVTNKSLGTNDWTAAQNTWADWQDWGQTTPPETEDQKNPSIAYAVTSFLTSAGPTGQNLDEDSVDHYKNLLEQRLVPYCEKKKYVYIREFDDLDVVTKFTESWVNLNPTRNRDIPAPKEPVLLADTTRKAGFGNRNIRCLLGLKLQSSIWRMAATKVGLEILQPLRCRIGSTAPGPEAPPDLSSPA